MKSSYSALAALSLLILILTVFSGISTARSLLQMSLADKIQQSDIVFAGKVISVKKPEIITAGINELAVVEVRDVLKGEITGKIKVVLKGYSSESDPICCDVGLTYLFFAKNGYSIMELKDSKFELVTYGKGRYISVVNGRFGTYLIRKNNVVGWSPSVDCANEPQSKATSVYRCIRSKIERDK